MTDYAPEFKSGDDGVFVVVERHPVSPEHIVGVTHTLHGAMLMTLDAAGFEMLVPTGEGDDNGEFYDSVPVDRNTKGATEKFRWHDESSIAGRYGRFQKGDGTLTAYFQDECSAFHVHWSSIENGE